MSILKNKWFLVVGVVVLFLVIRLPAIYTPYHQDEYKWPLYAEGVVYNPGSVPHPPLTEFIYRVIGQNIGLDNFRFIPLTFGFVNLFLLFYLVRFVAGSRSAFWTTFLFSIYFYYVLSSLKVDVDGAVMPFFFLIMSIGYFRLRENNFQILDYKIKNLLSIFLLSLGIVGGFLVKVVFILPVFALVVDFLIEKKAFDDKKKIFKYSLFTFFGLTALVGILFLVKYIFPFFDLSKAFRYWQHFAVFSGRGWVQTFIQFAKSIMYISPLLLIPLLFADKGVWNKWRPMFLFLIFNTIFYLFVFDFSLGALDRYFQFTVLPLSIISGIVFAKHFESKEKIVFKDYFVTMFFGVVLVLVQFLPHFVPPLYPKTEWLSKLFSLKWNFLFPFMGGSGPIPFYVSFLFIVVIWIISLVFVFSGLLNKDKIKKVLFAILVLGLFYNLIFVEEYMYGKINGSAKGLLKEAISYIDKNADIKKVVVYNDNGGWEVRKSGKYARRMYATPQFEEEYKMYLKNFDDHILFIDIPKVSQNSFYQNYFNSCRSVYSKKDKYINLQILHCF